MKKITTLIKCDTCDADISPRRSSYEAEYILHVKAENVALRSGITYAMPIYPPINNDLYFCNIKCMKKYGDEK